MTRFVEAGASTPEQTWLSIAPAGSLPAGVRSLVVLQEELRVDRLEAESAPDVPVVLLGRRAKDALTASLAEAGVGYTFLGDTLGGRRSRSLPPEKSPNGGLTHTGFRNYADYMGTAEFRGGVDRLLELAARQTVCVMCSEGWWVKCYRRLLADDLVARGVEVRHISSRVRADPHALDPLAVVSGDRVTYPPAGTTPPAATVGIPTASRLAGRTGTRGRPGKRG
jgi:hypothetical protein